MKKYLFFMFSIIILSVAPAWTLTFKIIAVEGAVDVQKAGGSWIKAKSGMVLKENTKIRTQLASKALLESSRGTKITVREDSIMDFQSLEGGEGNAPVNVRMKIWRGNLRAKVSKLRTGSSRFEINTPTAVAGVRGTDFSLDVEREGATKLQVQEGAVQFTSLFTQQGYLVGASQQSSADRSGVTQPETLNPEDYQADDFKSEIDLSDKTSQIPGPSANASDQVNLQVISPASGATLGQKSITIVGMASPGKNVTVGNSQVLADATGRFSARVELNEGDNVLNVVSGSSRVSLSYKVDSTKPVLSLGTLPFVTNQRTVTLNISTEVGAQVTINGTSVSAASGNVTYQLPLHDGNNAIALTAVDAAGNQSSLSSQISLDATPPLLTITQLLVDPSNDQSLIVTGQTEAGVQVTANGYPLEVRGDGSFSQVITWTVGADVTFEAKDAAGNITRDLRSVSGAVDVSPPVFQSLIFSPSSGQNGSQVVATLTATDASGLVQSLSIILSGPSGNSLNATLTLSSAGIYSGVIAIPSTAPGGDYTVSTISLVDSLGNRTSVNSGVHLTVSNPAPSPPASLSATDRKTGGAVDVSWSAVSASDFRDYTLLKSVSSGGPFSPLSTLSGNSFSSTGNANGTPIFFAVRATDIGGQQSNLSTVVSVTPTDQTAPSAPGNVKASLNTTGSGSQMTVSWSSVSGASSYNVYLNGALVRSHVSGSSVMVGTFNTGAYAVSVSSLDNNVAPPLGKPNESAQTTITVTVP